MSDFFVYKYRFIPSDEKDLFDKNTGKKVDEDFLRWKLGEMITTGKNLQMLKVGTNEPMLAKVLREHEGISLIAVHNKKQVKVYEELSDVANEYTSKPHCKVIINNRPGCQHIFIQKNSAFGGKGEKPVLMVKNYLDRLFQELSVCAEITPVYTKGKVWDVIERNRKRGVFVKSVKFDLDNKEQLEKPSNRFLLRMLRMGEKIDGSGMFGWTANSSKMGLQLKRSIGDFRNLVDYIGETSYRMTVRFYKGGGVYSEAESIRIVEILDKVVHEFIHGEKVMESFGFNLSHWIDNLDLTDAEEN